MANHPNRCLTCGGENPIRADACPACEPLVVEATTLKALTVADLAAQLGARPPTVRPPPLPPPPRPPSKPVVLEVSPAAPRAEAPRPAAPAPAARPRSTATPVLDPARPRSSATPMAVGAPAALPMSPLVAAFLGPDATGHVPEPPILDAEPIDDPEPPAALPRRAAVGLGRPGDDDLAADAPLREAIALEQAGHAEAAIGVLERALQTAPSSSRLLNRLALTLLGARHDVAAAERLLRQALSIAPGHPAYQRNLALVRSEAAKTRR